MDNPCFKCENRTKTCHSSCEKYAAFYAENKKHYTLTDKPLIGGHNSHPNDKKRIRRCMKGKYRS